MKATGIGTTAVFYILLGVSCPAFAGQEHQGEKRDQPQQRQGSHQQAGPQQLHGQQQPQQRANQPQRHVQQEARPAQNRSQQHVQQEAQQSQNRQSDHARGQQAGAPHAAPQGRQRAWQDHRASNWQSDHRSWQRRGGYSGYRIPEARYGGYFGSGHNFRIGGLPFAVVGGYPRFQYGGYWFSMVDPWPGDWANNWYDTDDVYVSYQDSGYYLFDRRHPGVGIAISVSM